MIIVQALLTVMIHSLGRVLNMVFGWATVMLFGRVPQERQIFLSIVAFGSVTWLVVVLGIAFPSMAAVLLTFAPIPKWVEEGWIRIAMLAAAVLVPPLVGESAIRAVNPDRQPRGAARIGEALISGYRFSLGIAVALVALILVGPILWIRDFRRRWVTRHVAVIVHRRDYADVLDAVQRALHSGGVRAQRGHVGGLLRFPTAVLVFVAGGRIQALDAETARLSAERVEILLYPFDLVISGDRSQVSLAQAIVAEHLPGTKAYMTWSEQGNALEDRLKQLGARVARELAQDLKTLCLSFDEWEVLFRELLMIQRDLLERRLAREQVRRTGSAHERMLGA